MADVGDQRGEIEETCSHHYGRKDRGLVYFFSMATSFTKAALGVKDRG
jgi:hypothetical protein